MEGSTGPSSRQRLDVPSTSVVERTLLAERLEQKPDIQAVAPSALLGKLQSFLPQMQASNEALDACAAFERDSDDEQAGPVVELDLACGLFDLKDDAAVSAAERSLAGVQRPTECSSSGEDSDGDDSEVEGGDRGDGAEEQQGRGGTAPARNESSKRRSLRGKATRHPGIQEL